MQMVLVDAELEQEVKQQGLLLESRNVGRWDRIGGIFCLGWRFL